MAIQRVSTKIIAYDTIIVRITIHVVRNAKLIIFLDNRYVKVAEIVEFLGGFLNLVY